MFFYLPPFLQVWPTPATCMSDSLSFCSEVLILCLRSWTLWSFWWRLSEELPLPSSKSTLLVLPDPTTPLNCCPMSAHLFSSGIFLNKMEVWGTSLLAQWIASTCQCRQHGFNPWFAKMPHDAEQRSPWAATTEAHVSRAGAPQQGKPPHGAATARSSPPLTTTRESPCKAMKTQHSQKLNKWK